MFTGLTTAIGTVVAREERPGGLTLVVACPYPPSELTLGESIACSGTCLTVVSIAAHADGSVFGVELSNETLARTAAHGWEMNARLNLERALRAGDRLGGHLVSGHVDATARLLSLTQEGESRHLLLEAPTALARFLAVKGSVTLDGVSLTVNQVDHHRFSVTLIPHTWAVTTLSDRQEGDLLNLEIDQLARYLDQLLVARGLA